MIIVQDIIYWIFKIVHEQIVQIVINKAENVLIIKYTISLKTRDIVENYLKTSKTSCVHQHIDNCNVIVFQNTEIKKNIKLVNYLFYKLFYSYKCLIQR